MSRDIKFRIWDLDKKEWLGESDEDSLTFYGFALIGECMTVQSPRKWRVNGVVEQYTGIKDKNGEEIYEGDIVEFPSMLGGKIGRATVFWQEGGFICNGTMLNKYAHIGCEVVGNIHENSELLEKI